MPHDPQLPHLDCEQCLATSELSWRTHQSVAVGIPKSDLGQGSLQLQALPVGACLLHAGLQLSLQLLAGDLARSLHFQPLHGLFHFGCELERQADSFGRLLAFAEGGGLGPLRRVPAQRFGRQKFTALLVGENVAKSEIHLERSFQAFGGRSLFLYRLQKKRCPTN